MQTRFNIGDIVWIEGRDDTAMACEVCDYSIIEAGNKPGLRVLKSDMKTTSHWERSLYEHAVYTSRNECLQVIANKIMKKATDRLANVYAAMEEKR